MLVLWIMISQFMFSCPGAFGPWATNLGVCGDVTSWGPFPTQSIALDTVVVWPFNLRKYAHLFFLTYNIGEIISNFCEH